MTSDNIMLLFDAIIFIYGAYAIISGIRMKTTHVPSAILLAKNELYKVKNAKDFCICMSRPTVVFGAAACIYSILDVTNQFWFRIIAVDMVALVCFFIVCGWYVKELRKEKEKYVAQ